MDYNGHYKKYLERYKILKQNGGKKDRPSPSDSATLYAVGTEKKGNDGNIWIIAKDKNGVHRWKRLDNKKEKVDSGVEFYEFDKFAIFRNGSKITPKLKEKNIVKIINNDTLYIKMSSQYVPQADGQIIKMPLNKMEGIGTVMDPKDCQLVFKYGGIYYMLYLFLDQRKNGTEQVRTLLSKYEDEDIPGDLYFDSMKIIPEHHYGTLLRLTNKIIRNLKSNTSYIIFQANMWFWDYFGKRLETFDFKNLYDFIESGKKISDRTTWELPYSLIISQDNYDSNDEGFFITGGGDDPIFIIYDWQKGFKPPKQVKKCKTLKEVGLKLDDLL